MNTNIYLWHKNYNMLKSFKNYLVSNNINISEENQVTISFEYSNLNYVAIFDENDPFYFRLALPNILSVENENNITQLYEIINATNVNFKAIKTIIYNKNIWILIEEFVYSKESIDELFKRSIENLKFVFADFKDKINKK